MIIWEQGSQRKMEWVCFGGLRAWVVKPWKFESIERWNAEAQVWRYWYREIKWLIKDAISARVRVGGTGTLHLTTVG